LSVIHRSIDTALSAKRRKREPMDGSALSRTFKRDAIGGSEVVSLMPLLALSGLFVLFVNLGELPALLPPLFFF
jgi:hypothetical protein